jgi:hypothetical protein
MLGVVLDDSTDVGCRKKFDNASFICKDEEEMDVNNEEGI